MICAKVRYGSTNGRRDLAGRCPLYTPLADIGGVIGRREAASAAAVLAAKRRVILQ